MKKRGVIEVQFNWVFVLIVGAVILLFFTTAILRQKDISEAKIASTILTDLETITTGAKVSRSTFQVIHLPDTKVKFLCDDCLCKFYIGDSSKPFRDKVIFSPSEIKGRKILAWTQEFSYPFRVSNLLFLTGPMVRYVIRNPENALEGILINKSLPQEVLHDYNPGTVEDMNHDKVKFVYIDTTIENNDAFALKHMKDNDVSAIEVSTVARTITFYYKVNDEWGPAEGTTNWVSPTREDLYGAFFAENIEMYNCQMREIFKRMAISSNIYLQKTANFKSYFERTLNDCQHHYIPALSTLDSLKQLAASLQDGFPSTLDLNQLSTASDKLNNQNNNIMIKYCPEIY